MSEIKIVQQQVPNELPFTKENEVTITVKVSPSSIASSTSFSETSDESVSSTVSSTGTTTTTTTNSDNQSVSSETEKRSNSLSLPPMGHILQCIDVYQTQQQLSDSQLLLEFNQRPHTIDNDSQKQHSPQPDPAQTSVGSTLGINQQLPQTIQNAPSQKLPHLGDIQPLQPGVQQMQHIQTQSQAQQPLQQHQSHILHNNYPSHIQQGSVSVGYPVYPYQQQQQSQSQQLHLQSHLQPHLHQQAPLQSQMQHQQIQSQVSSQSQGDQTKAHSSSRSNSQTPSEQEIPTNIQDISKEKSLLKQESDSKSAYKTIDSKSRGKEEKKPEKDQDKQLKNLQQQRPDMHVVSPIQMQMPVQPLALRFESPSGQTSVELVDSNGNVSMIPLMGSKKRTNLPRETIQILNEWIVNNMDNPYPNHTQKRILIERTGLSSIQLSNWFINKRRRRIFSNLSGNNGQPIKKKRLIDRI